jgi:hypothetical protein
MLAIYRRENFIQEKTKWRRVKNSVYHPRFLTHQGLSNYTTFRPIQSGATVPLMQYNQQANPLLSMTNYTPLVISGNDKKSCYQY